MWRWYVQRRSKEKRKDENQRNTKGCFQKKEEEEIQRATAKPKRERKKEKKQEDHLVCGLPWEVESEKTQNPCKRERDAAMREWASPTMLFLYILVGGFLHACKTKKPGI